MADGACTTADRVLRLVLAVAATACIPCQGADIYKWTDERGRIHYGDRPTAAGAEPLTVHTRPPDDHRLPGRIEKRDRLLQVLAEERREREEATLREQEARAEREARCEKARRRMQSYTHARQLYEQDEAGNRRVLTDMEHEHARAEARELVRQWCE